MHGDREAIAVCTDYLFEPPVLTGHQWCKDSAFTFQ